MRSAEGILFPSLSPFPIIPGVDASDGAAVRIAMTVGTALAKRFGLLTNSRPRRRRRWRCDQGGFNRPSWTD